MNYVQISHNEIYGALYAYNGTKYVEYKMLRMKDIITSTMSNDISETGGAIEIQLTDYDFAKQLKDKIKTTPLILIRMFDGISLERNNTKIYFIQSGGVEETVNEDTKITEYVNKFTGVDILGIMAYKYIINNVHIPLSSFEVDDEGNRVEPDTWMRYTKNANASTHLEYQLVKVLRDGLVPFGTEEKVVSTSTLKGLGTITIIPYTGSPTKNVDLQVTDDENCNLLNFLINKLEIFFYTSTLNDGLIDIYIKHIDPTATSEMDISWYADYNKPTHIVDKHEMVDDFKNVVYNVDENFNQVVTTAPQSYLHTSKNFISTSNESEESLSDYNNSLINGFIYSINSISVEYDNLPLEPFLEFDVGTKVVVNSTTSDVQYSTFVSKIEEVIEGNSKTISVEFYQEEE